jgi:hypothetical protein
MTRSLLACGSLVVALLGSSCARNARDRLPAAGIAATDALWALAPAGTVTGIVIAPGTGTLLVATWGEAERVVGRWPLVREVLAEARKQAPVELFDAEARARMGIDIAGGAAVFLDAQDDGVLVLPVVDRARFRQRLGLRQSLETTSDVVDDVMGDLRCREVARHYVCAKSTIVLGAVGKSPAMARRIAARPRGLRGAIEIEVGISGIDEADRKELTSTFAGMTAIQLAVQIAPGVVTARAFMDGKATDPFVRDAWQVPGTLSRRVAARRPGGTLQLRLPLFSAETARELADAAQEMGVALRAEDIASLTGELVLASASGDVLDVSLQLGARDGKRLQPLVTHLCQEAQGLELPITVRMQDQRCSARILPTDLALIGVPPGLVPQRPLEIVLAAGDTALTVRATMLGQLAARGTEVSAIGRELLDEPWTLAVWGQGSVLRKLEDAPALPLAELEGLAEAWRMGAWFLAHVTEIGAGLALREEGVYAVLHVGTHWANPERVLRMYQALVDRMLAGDAGVVDDFAALAVEHPDTPLGRAYASGPGGFLVLGATAGVLAAVAAPAFDRLLQRTKEYQAGMFPHGDGARPRPVTGRERAHAGRVSGAGASARATR